MRKILCLITCLIFIGGHQLIARDVIPYKIDLSYGNISIKPFSSIEFHARQLLPIDYKNYFKLGLTNFNSSTGYQLAYEQQHKNGLLSFSTGEQFLFTDIFFKNKFVYPSASFFGATWENVHFKQWFLDSDTYSLININNVIWFSYFNQNSIDNLESMTTASLGGNIKIDSLYLNIFTDIHSSSASKDNSSYSGTTIKLEINAPTMNIVQKIKISPQISYITIQNNRELTFPFLPINSDFMYSSFYESINNSAFNQNISLINSRFIFDIDDLVTPYIKTSSFSKAQLLTLGLIYNWRNNVGFQFELEQNSIEDGVGFWIRCLLFDQLII